MSRWSAKMVRQAPRHPTPALWAAIAVIFWSCGLAHSEASPSPEEEDSTADSNLADLDGWGPWGAWSPCSRTCDGGVSTRSRRCMAKMGCVGDATRTRICNMQACPEPVDFRAAQCAAFDRVPYRGRLYEWTPVQDPSDPCSLTCQARQFKFMAKLAPRAQDGTRCREGALDMCVQGRCLPVGCDLELGSLAEVDECGICGGNGTTCRAPIFSWAEAPFSLCSATCGGGIQESHPVCTSSDTGAEVDDRLCDVDSRPDSRVRTCSSNPCPPGWELSEWGECSASCGGGRQMRNVSCVRPSVTIAAAVAVADHFCPGQRPPSARPCNAHPCSRWTEGQWSQCSATCGVGTQTRAVECRDVRGRKSHLCDPKRRPRSKQQCSSGNPCFFKGKEFGSQEDAPPQSFAPFNNIYSKPQHQSPEPSFIVGDWGSCSVTCGDGVQKRSVQCKIFLEFSRTMARIPDKECSGIRPAEMQRCTLRPCALDQNRGESEEDVDEEGDPDIGEGDVEVGGKQAVPYSWRSAGYTPCSASCLGGIRESLVECVRNVDNAPVSYVMCDIKDKPVTVTETCNNKPCPPRWNSSDFTTCTKPCGGGSQWRSVQCVHEVTRGVGNTLVVPDSHCPEPRPQERRMCNLVDCVARWKPDKWTKCSKSCDGGVKTRKIRCQRELAYGSVAELPPSKCASRRKPRAVKPCNSKPCRGLKGSVQGGPERKVSLTAEGAASVYRGTTLKMRCPGVVVNASTDTSRVKWLKDGAPVKASSRRIAVSRKGALRIRKMDFDDSGVYVCSTGTSSGQLILSVKPLASESPAKGIDQETFSSKDLGGVGGKLSKGVDFPAFINSVDDVTNKKRAKVRDNQRIHEVKGTLEDPTVRSGAASHHAGASIPSIQTLLSDFHKRLGGGGGGGSSSSSQVKPKSRSLEDEDDALMHNSYVLGRGNADSLQFEWETTSWSLCSQTCGGGGLQVRAAQCMVRLNNVSRTVDSTLCVDAGMEAPMVLQSCGSDSCPRWVTGPWSECSEGRCLGLSRSIQRRPVSCRLANDTAVEDEQCDPSTRPQDQQECFSELCRGVWKVGEWSECTATCGGSGFRTRILRCVWYGTDKPAGDSCRSQDRPEVLQGCEALPCGAVRENCEDHSRNCQMVRQFNMCHLKDYHNLCCVTCNHS